MKKKYSIKNNKLYDFINDSYCTHFNNKKITSVLYGRDKSNIILLFDYYSAEKCYRNKNIISISNNGDILWTIDKLHKLDSYLYINKNNDKYSVYTEGGYVWDLDEQTGHISNPIFTK